jgi:hypothetical protein
MTLQVPAGSPWWVSVAADALLFFHIAGGAVGLVSGAAALIARKGGRAHRIAGLVFCVSMTVMASIGAAVSPFLPIPQRANVLAGILTLYLVVSAWMAVRHTTVTAGRLEISGLVVALTTAAAGVLWAVQASYTRSGTLDGSPPQSFYVFIVMGTLAAAGDLRLIVKGRISGAPRLTRHVWRMCAALFIAAGSFFLGQQRVMPVWMRGSPLLFVPAFAPLVWMVVWIVRIRLVSSTPRRPPVGRPRAQPHDVIRPSPAARGMAAGHEGHPTRDR